MASEVHGFAVVVPAGTSIAKPLKVNLGFAPQEVVEIRVRVPPGPRGEVGFQIGQAGVQRYPYETGAFIVTDNREVVWTLEKANTSGAWQLIVYNTGSFNHTLQVDFLCTLIDPSAPTVPEPITNRELSSLPALSLS